MPQYVIKEHIITDNGLIVENNEIKYLGVFFDSSLNFSKQIHAVTCKLNRLVGIF